MSCLQGPYKEWWSAQQVSYCALHRYMLRHMQQPLHHLLAEDRHHLAGPKASQTSCSSVPAHKFSAQKLESTQCVSSLAVVGPASCIWQRLVLSYECHVRLERTDTLPLADN